MHRLQAVALTPLIFLLWIVYFVLYVYHLVAWYAWAIADDVRIILHALRPWAALFRYFLALVRVYRVHALP